MTSGRDAQEFWPRPDFGVCVMVSVSKPFRLLFQIRPGPRRDSLEAGYLESRCIVVSLRQLLSMQHPLNYPSSTPQRYWLRYNAQSIGGCVSVFLCFVCLDVVTLLWWCLELVDDEVVAR